MSDEIDKVAADAALYGLGIMKDGKAIPIEEALAAPPAMQAKMGEMSWQLLEVIRQRNNAETALADAQARIAALKEALREIEMLHYGDGSLVDDHKAAHKLACDALKGGE